MKRTLLKIAVVLLSLSGVAVAKDKASKDYPLKGTVVSFHAQQEVSGNESGVDTYERRVYVVKTDTGTLEITGWEKGRTASKRPPLSIGQTLTFRSDGKFIYTVLEDGKEHRYYIVAAD